MFLDEYLNRLELFVIFDKYLQLISENLDEMLLMQLNKCKKHRHYKYIIVTRVISISFFSQYTCICVRVYGCAYRAYSIDKEKKKKLYFACDVELMIT